MAKRKSCQHDDTDDTLVLIDAHISGRFTMIRKACLVSFCHDCETEKSQYVSGGLLIQEKRA